MMEKTQSAHERWRARIGGARVPVTPSIFPKDAVAVIYKPSRSATTSGRARTGDWKLRFEPRSRQQIDPLMGWTESDDPLGQIELSFPSAEAAVSYARRQGLPYVLRGETDLDANVRQISKGRRTSSPEARIRPRRLEWVERTLGADVMRRAARSGSDPGSRYAHPRDVLNDSTLSEPDKRDVLQRWALDAYRIELALSEGEEVAHPSRLDEVVDALLELDEESRRLIAGAGAKPNRDYREAAA